MTLHDKELMEQLKQTFQIEAVEHLQALNQALLQIEKQPDESTLASLLQKAFRDAHSLKGAARAVALKDIEALAHRMEDVLKLARDGEIKLDPNICDVLYDTLDGIQSLLNKQDVEVPKLLDNLLDILGQEALRSEYNSVQQNVDEYQENESNGTKQVKANSNHSEDETIRVAVSKLDALMAQAGELVSARISAESRTTEMKDIRSKVRHFPSLWQEVKNRMKRINTHDEHMLLLNETLQQYHDSVEEILKEFAVVDVALKRDSLRLGMVTEQLQDEMRRVRMLPFYTQEPMLNRVVRDAARSENKAVRLEIAGGDVELDKKVLDTLHDSLLHLVRNAVAHGIESTEERLHANKEAEGCIRITIQQRGNEAHIIVGDDGRGFQIQDLRAISNGHNESEDELINLAFQSGITTMKNANEIAGRGVGLDVVRQHIEELQGRISVENHPGQGVDIRLIVPVSLAMTRVLVISAANVQYALPLASVEKILPLQDTFLVEGKLRMNVDKRPLTVVPLAQILGGSPEESTQSLVVVIAVAEQRIALLVDDVLTEQELAVKSFSRPLVKVHHLAGAALLGNGTPIVVLNTADLVKSAHGLRDISIPLSSIEQEEEDIETASILVVDDSITTRTLEKNILHAAGYLVMTATDGIEALNILQQNEVDLVVADVEMPNMDGIILTRKLRESDEFGELPIILVTSLESKEDRERGMVAGANAYIVKRGFNQAELLTTIRHFI